MMQAGLSPVGTLTVRSGEPFAMHVFLVDGQGDAQDLTGRSFALAFRLSSQSEPLLTIDAELDNEARRAIALGTAEQASTVYLAGVSRALSYDIVELSSGASITRWTGRVNVAPGPDFPSDVVPVAAYLPASEALLNPQALVASERGAMGFGAERRLYDAGLIPEPTVEKMDERYLQAGAEGARPYAEAAEAARDVSIDRATVADERATDADNAALRADLSAAQATTASRLYATTAEGLAAVVEQETFSVAGTGSVYAITYRKVSGAAVEIGRYPSKAAYDAIASKLPDINAAAAIPLIVSALQALLWFDGTKLRGLGIDDKATVAALVAETNARLTALPNINATPDLVPLVTTAGKVWMWLRGGQLDAAGAAPHLRWEMVQDIVTRLQAGDRIPLIKSGTRVYLWLDANGLHGPNIDGKATLDQVKAAYEPRQSPAGAIPMATDRRALHRWRAHREKVKLATPGAMLSLAVGDDSWGQLAEISNAFRNLATAKGYQGGGEGFRSAINGDAWAGSAYVISANWTKVDGSTTDVFPYKAGPNGENIYTSLATETIAWTNVAATEIHIYDFQFGGTWRWRIDSGGWNTVTADGSGAFRKTTISGLSDANHSLEIDTDGNTGVVSFAGFFAKRGVVGAQILKLGNGGLTGLRLAGFAPYMDAPIADMQPSAAISFLATNDYVTALSPVSVYLAGLQAKVDHYRAAVPDMGFIFVIPPRTNRTAVTPLSAYRDALHGWCVANGHAFYNAYDAWGDFATANAQALFKADGIHVNDLGAAVLAAEINNQFLHL